MLFILNQNAICFPQSQTLQARREDGIRNVAQNVGQEPGSFLWCQSASFCCELRHQSYAQNQRFSLPGSIKMWNWNQTQGDSVLGTRPRVTLSLLLW